MKNVLKFFLLLTMLTTGRSAAESDGRRGGIALQFDDGWTSWRTVVAPELRRVGGRATGFVNNQYIANGRVTLEDLAGLQDEYGWEIGTHTYNHHNAVRFVQQHGIDAWLDGQLVSALEELRNAGTEATNLVFPFNAYTPEIAQAVLGRGVTSYRRADPMALAEGLRPDGSLPGTSFDLTRYMPLATFKQWVDMAHRRNQVLFLYGHRVVPDEAFVTGRVVSVTSGTLVADQDVVLPVDEDVVLVPDMNRRSTGGAIGGLAVAGGRTIKIPEGGADLMRLTAPGSVFLIGPSYGTRLSDFVGLIEYAAEKLHFYTVKEIVDGKHTGAAEAAGRAAK